MSTGQRKRLALLCAYIEDRPIYILDEWAADQDPVFKRFFYEVLVPDLKSRGNASSSSPTTISTSSWRIGSFAWIAAASSPIRPCVPCGPRLPDEQRSGCREGAHRLSQTRGTVAVRRTGFDGRRCSVCPGNPLQTRSHPGV
nr:hypothetical protein [Burkholderia contaminans]